MMKNSRFKRSALALAVAGALAWGMAACGGSSDDGGSAGGGGGDTTNPWMTSAIVAEQGAAPSDEAREQVARRRAGLLLSAMTLDQKIQQLTGSMPEILHELPECYGARHVSAIPALNIPTFRITNGPVGVGQNDCVAASLADDVKSGKVGFTVAYTDPSSAKATALPAAMGVAASFEPEVAAAFGGVIATEMNNLALHVFEAPGLNMARIPVLGRNFEYFGEDPYLTGAMGVAEIRAIQSQNLIGMAKHFVGNEQEANRQRVQETIDPQVLREIYLLPFEMAVKDAKVAAIMCAYNYVNGVHSCENDELLNKVLRKDWGFTGYVQSDFFAIKSTVGTLKGGLDHEMPIPQFWAPANIKAALGAGSISVDLIDQALARRYTQMFKWGIFDRPLKQTPIDFKANGAVAREIGSKAAVLLQNNGALPFNAALTGKVVVIGKATQVYAQQAVAGGAMVGKAFGSGGGSSDVVPEYSVKPVEGLQDVLKRLGNTSASVQLMLVDDANATATIDGASVSFSAALAAAAQADAVIVMAGTISEEGADRLTAADGSSLSTVVPLAPGASAADGLSLDWYVPGSLTTPATSPSGANPVKNSNTVAMINRVLATPSTTGVSMKEKTALVLKDNAGVAVPPELVGSDGPAILEVWFPGQEDGHIVADLLFGVKTPGGKLPVTFPYAGKSFLDSATALQYPGEVNGTDQAVEYTEKLHIGYRWYDANVSGQCAEVAGVNPCVAFPFGHGLSYTTFDVRSPSVGSAGNGAYRVTATVRNTGAKDGEEVVQVYVSLPASADAVGAKQPPKRLVGFQKVFLKAGESRDVAIVVDPDSSHHPLSVWDESARTWRMPAGEYTFRVGASSASHALKVAGTVSH